MSGPSRNYSCIKSLLRLGSNPSDQDDLAKGLEPTLLSPNDRAGARANILSLIRLCPNAHEVVLVRLLEHFHRLVEVYPVSFIMTRMLSFEILKRISPKRITRKGQNEPGCH